MAGLQSGEGRMMIDSVVWAQHINVTDRHTDRQTDSHVAIANVTPTHCVGRQKSKRFVTFHDLMTIRLPASLTASVQ